MKIRDKLFLGFGLYLLFAMVFGALAYKDLNTISTHLRHLEISDDIANSLLEVRRYEKNYLLYGSAADLEENRQYMQQGRELLTKIAPEVGDLKGAPHLSLLEKEFMMYGRLMERLVVEGPREGQPDGPFVEEELRDSGKTLVELSQQLVAFERQRILNILKHSEPSSFLLS